MFFIFGARRKENPFSQDSRPEDCDNLGKSAAKAHDSTISHSDFSSWQTTYTRMCLLFPRVCIPGTAACNLRWLQCRGRNLSGTGPRERRSTKRPSRSSQGCSTSSRAGENFRLIRTRRMTCCCSEWMLYTPSVWREEINPCGYMSTFTVECRFSPPSSLPLFSRRLSIFQGL
jgi:hypothetical protein